MGVKLNKETSDVIHVSQMKDGQIAEIISGVSENNMGTVVKRHKDNLFSISRKDTWSDIFSWNLPSYSFKVRILKNGETLTITDNE